MEVGRGDKEPLIVVTDSNPKAPVDRKEAAKREAENEVEEIKGEVFPRVSQASLDFSSPPRKSPFALCSIWRRRNAKTESAHASTPAGGARAIMQAMCAVSTRRP